MQGTLNPLLKAGRQVTRSALRKCRSNPAVKAGHDVQYLEGHGELVSRLILLILKLRITLLYYNTVIPQVQCT